MTDLWETGDVDHADKEPTIPFPPAPKTLLHEIKELEKHIVRQFFADLNKSRGN